jgi:hypothetical protein
MIFEPSRDEVRRFFCEAWRKRRDGLPLEALETIAADWIALHPEYHDDLVSLETALAAQYPVDAGRTNPFLHLAMHLSVAEQLQIDQPPGIRAAHDSLARRLGCPHEAAHRIIDCLGETIWRAQREHREPDGEAYLECILRQAR